MLQIDIGDHFLYLHSVTSDQIYKPIGELVRRRRKKMKLTQAQLSSRVGISRASLANIETGRQSVVVHQIYAIAAALDVSPHDLLPLGIGKSADSTGSDADVILPNRGLNNVQREQILELIRNVSSED